MNLKQGFCDCEHEWIFVCMLDALKWKLFLQIMAEEAGVMISYFVTFQFWKQVAYNTKKQVNMRC